MKLMETLENNYELIISFLCGWSRCLKDSNTRFVSGFSYLALLFQKANKY